MAEDFLEGLYIEADAYTAVNCMIRQYRNGNSDSDFQKNLNYYIQNVFSEISRKLVENGEISGQVLWESMLKLRDIHQLTVCLDVLEGEILPIIAGYLKSQPRIDVEDNGICLKSSDAGFLYLSDVNTQIRYDSCINPMQEAYEIISDYYRPSMSKYIFLGCGLGYIPYQLYKESDGDVEITIVFHNKKHYDYARLYGVLDWIPSECLKVIVSDDILTFMSEMIKGYEDYYFYPMDYRMYPSSEMITLNNLSVSLNTRFSANKFTVKNYYHNIRKVEKCITDMPRKDCTDKFLIVAGGPSVDENIDFITNSKNNGFTVISVGTVFKKLLSSNIIPDFVTACDPFISVYSQFENLEDCKNVTLIIGVSTNYNVARNYDGPKYFAICGNDPKEAIEYASEHNYKLFEACETVTSFAYDIAVHLGAKEIYLVGADYGFPGGVSHASGTAYRKTVNNPDHIDVRSVDGSMIKASKQMIGYRIEMEELIERNPSVKTYNLSKHGAVIKGALPYQI